MLKNRFKKILIPLDGSLNSNRGLNEAISLARSANSKIIGVHVLPIYPKNVVGTFDTYLKYQKKMAKKSLEKAKISSARHGIEFQEKILYSNDIANMIVKFANSSKSDLIVIGSRGKANPKAGYLGSVATGVVYSAKLPVLLVK